MVTSSAVVGSSAIRSFGSQIIAEAIITLRRHDMKMEGKILFEGNELLHTDRETLRQLQGNQIGVSFTINDLSCQHFDTFLILPQYTRKIHAKF